MIMQPEHSTAQERNIPKGTAQGDTALTGKFLTEALTDPGANCEQFQEMGNSWGAEAPHDPTRQTPNIGQACDNCKPQNHTIRITESE